MISDEAIELIKKYEGLRLTAYRCPAGILTIGYGHTGPDVYSGQKITSEQADELLMSDIWKAIDSVTKLVTPELNDNQLGALVSFVFNVGESHFRSSTMCKLLNLGKFQQASEQFDRWVYANNKILNGLVKRRAEEKALFLK